MAADAAAASRCVQEAERRLRASRQVSLSTDLAAYGVDGVALLGPSSFMADGTEVRAAKVRAGRAASLALVTAMDWQGADGAQARDGVVEGRGPEPPACRRVERQPCTDVAVRVSAGRSAGTLPVGTYGDVLVEPAATLLLAAGRYELCSLSVRPGARVIARHGARIAIAGDLEIDRGASLAGESETSIVVAEVAGARVRVAAGAKIHADVRAPSARITIGPQASLIGSTCGNVVRIGRRARVSCRPVQTWMFSDVSEAAGAAGAHAWSKEGVGEAQLDLMLATAGVAAGDYDGDGDVDLYTIGGDLGTNHLLRNRGDGTFEDVAAEAGGELAGTRGCGPSFVDTDGDGVLDLVVGGVRGEPLRLLRGRGDGTFEDATAQAGLDSPAAVNHFGTASADVDGDGDLDLFVAHWGSLVSTSAPMEHLWLNRGDGTYEPGTAAAGLTAWGPASGRFVIWTFAPGFADMNGDARPDLLVASDFGTEEYFLNRGDGTFERATSEVNSAENAMGSAVGDYDGDGDLDWFVSSIWDPNGVAERNWGVTGNRLYRNLGDGTLEDATDEAGVRYGYWGWGACFADFDLDGNLDLLHVNGYTGGDAAAEFESDPSVLYISNGDGTFDERAVELGLDDRGQGRGVVCFDYDGDGDIDVFVAQNDAPARLLRNDLGAGGNFVSITLAGRSPNTQAVGARVEVDAGGRTQVREIRIGNNYVSQDPALAHFGLGTADVIDELRIAWPAGMVTVEHDIEANRSLVRVEP